MPSTLTACAVSGTNSARVERRAARWNTHADLELAHQAREQVPVEDVAGAHHRALPRHLVRQRAQVERQDLAAVEIGQAADERLAHLAAGAGDEHDGLAGHEGRLGAIIPEGRWYSSAEPT